MEKETKYFCARNLSKWQQQWSHQEYVSKMYIGNNEFKEFIGWDAINQNTVDHITEFPEPIPIPTLGHQYDIKIFQETALVFYSQK